MCVCVCVCVCVCTYMPIFLVNQNEVGQYYRMWKGTKLVKIKCQKGLIFPSKTTILWK